MLVEDLRNCRPVHKGHGNVAAEAEDHKHQQGEEKLFTNFRDLPSISKGLDHLDHLSLSPCRFDFFSGGFGEVVGLDVNRNVNVAVT